MEKWNKSLKKRDNLIIHILIYLYQTGGLYKSETNELY